MATKNKTQPTSASVDEFLATFDDDRRKECQALVQLMQSESGCEPVMWGAAIIGFGRYHYRYDSGREGDFMRVGFSPRKQNLALYIIPGVNHYAAHLDNLGKHKLGKSCLYIKHLSDVNTEVLRQLVRDSLIDMLERYPE